MIELIVALLHVARLGLAILVLGKLLTELRELAQKCILHGLMNPGRGVQKPGRVPESGYGGSTCDNAAP